MPCIRKGTTPVCTELDLLPETIPRVRKVLCAGAFPAGRAVSKGTEK